MSGGFHYFVWRFFRLAHLVLDLQGALVVGVGYELRVYMYPYGWLIYSVLFFLNRFEGEYFPLTSGLRIRNGLKTIRWNYSYEIRSSSGTNSLFDRKRAFELFWIYFLFDRYSLIPSVQCTFVWEFVIRYMTNALRRQVLYLRDFLKILKCANAMYRHQRVSTVSCLLLLL